MSEQVSTKERLFHCCYCDKMLPLSDFRVYDGTRKGVCMRCEPKESRERAGAKREAKAVLNAGMRKAEGTSPFSAWPLNRKSRAAARKRKQAVVAQ